MHKWGVMYTAETVRTLDEISKLVTSSEMGISDKEKHQALLKALNAQGRLKGLMNLIHTTKDYSKVLW